MKRLSGILVGALLTFSMVGCASSATPAGDGGTDVVSTDVGVSDASSTPDSTVPFDGAAFCGNPNSARIALNGVVAESPSARAQEVFLNCCEAGMIQVVTARFTDSFTLMWRHELGGGSNLPIDLDLANLPDGWSVSLADGCDPTMGSCTPRDEYTSGMTGTLHIERTAPGQLRMSTCLDATESAAMPHPVVHSLQLWVPPITAM